MSTDTYRDISRHPGPDDGTDTPPLVWLGALVENVESGMDSAIRLGRSRAQAYYVTYDADAERFVVYRHSTVADTYDADDPYLESLIDYYEPMMVNAADVAAIEDNR